MEYRIKLACFSSVLILAIAITGSIVTASALASRAYTKRMEQIQQSQREITVKGKATKRILGDYGVWNVRTKSNGTTLSEAYQSLEETNSAISTFLDEQGFSVHEIGLGPITTETHYARDEEGHKSRDVEGYTLNRLHTIRSGKLRELQQAASEITELIARDMQVISAHPEFTVTTLPDIKVALLAQAASNARDRARRIVEGSGGRLTELKSVRQGVIQVTRPDSTRVSSYGIYDTSTIAKDASVVVTVTFGIEDAP
ncbi:MAG: SIMPL domain-containing protein [Planctomycetota bacterium]|nr:SIMPL domain-containing protein [Planctomycetota bacterium]